MPATIFDSSIFRDIFTTPAMREVWSDENRVQKYLDFEAALARAQAKLGIIPKNAAAEIVKHCDVKKIDFAKLKERTEKDRLSGAAGRPPAHRAVQERPRRMVRIGARPRRTSPTPRPSCRSASRST